jgi:hypothetical protein
MSCVKVELSKNIKKGVCLFVLIIKSKHEKLGKNVVLIFDYSFSIFICYFFIFFYSKRDKQSRNALTSATFKSVANISFADVPVDSPTIAAIGYLSPSGLEDKRKSAAR